MNVRACSTVTDCQLQLNFAMRQTELRHVILKHQLKRKCIMKQATTAMKHAVSDPEEQSQTVAFRSRRCFCLCAFCEGGSCERKNSGEACTWTPQSLRAAASTSRSVLSETEISAVFTFTRSVMVATRALTCLDADETEGACTCTFSETAEEST